MPRDFLFRLTTESLPQYRTLYDRMGCGAEIGEFCREPALSDQDAARHSLQLLRRELPPGIPKVFHGPFWDINPQSQDRAVRQLSREKIGRALEQAHFLDCERIVFHTSLLPMVNLNPLAEANLHTAHEFWLELAKQAALEICLENTWEEDASILEYLVCTQPHPRLGICLDAGHISAFTRHPAEYWYERLGKYIRHLHWHDNHGGRDEHLSLGAGTIDWQKHSRLTRQYAPQALVTLEVSGVQAYTASLDYLQNLAD